MRWLGCLPLVVVATCAPGCNIAHYASRNLVNEPQLTFAEGRLEGRLKREARSLLAAKCLNPVPTASYADGFADGYAHLALYGGEPLPPGAPPAKYRRHVNDFTLAGQADQRDYLSGFQAGAETAVACNRRESLLVLTVLPNAQAEQKLIINCVPAPANVNLKQDAPVAPSPASPAPAGVRRDSTPILNPIPAISPGGFPSVPKEDRQSVRPSEEPTPVPEPTPMPDPAGPRADADPAVAPEVVAHTGLIRLPVICPGPLVAHQERPASIMGRLVTDASGPDAAAVAGTDAPQGEPGERPIRIVSGTLIPLTLEQYADVDWLPTLGVAVTPLRATPTRSIPGPGGLKP